MSIKFWVLNLELYYTQSPIPNPQSPIPNPKSQNPIKLNYLFYLIYFI